MLFRGFSARMLARGRGWRMDDGRFFISESLRVLDLLRTRARIIGSVQHVPVGYEHSYSTVRTPTMTLESVSLAPRTH
jgi:hypothetical protein